MDTKDQFDEFDLDDIMKEFGTSGEPGEEEASPDETAEGELLPAEPQPEENTGDTMVMPPLEPRAPEAGDAALSAETIRLDDLEDVAQAVPPRDAAPLEPASEDSAPEPFSEGWEPEYEQPMGEYTVPTTPPPIPFQPRSRLRELKRKLIAGPEKRYYELAEQGLGKLQLAILGSFLIVLLCGAATAMFALGMVPASRMKLMIFSQILAMLGSALLGCHVMMEGAIDLFKLRFSPRTMLLVSFMVCCADAYFCVRQLRVPCCAAFSLEVTMALWSRYHRRSTEMGQMDTMRKANHLDSLCRVEDFYQGSAGLLRGEGQVEDFMDNYQTLSGPEKVQNLYTFISFMACIGIAVLASLRHSLSIGIQILATSLLVAIPASTFISLTRPASILQRRLHMVGTVLCGWQGIKQLCKSSAIPLTDEDIFPLGSAKLNGVKFYGDREPDIVVEYAASLIEACGSNLDPLFKQLLATRSGVTYQVENFQRYLAGGVGGEVCREPVLLGTSEFLKSMGVEIPEGTMVSQAVYAAIDGQLCAVFAINYNRVKSSAAGLTSLCAYRRLTPVLVCRDFMLTNDFLHSKFGVNTRRMAFPEQAERDALAQRRPGEEDPALALITQDTLSSVAYAVSGARALRTASRLGVGVHMFGGILGLLIMAALAYLGSSELLTPVNVLLYQLVWLIPGFLVTEWTRSV